MLTGPVRESKNGPNDIKNLSEIWDNYDCDIISKSHQKYN